MGGRAVGGIGAGCAGFSLVGLLAAVAIVVWLASQTFGATPRRSAPPRPTTTTVPHLAPLPLLPEAPGGS
jgi:hypothetical protein